MGKISNRAIFLDFDGVLFDTVCEAYVVSLVALGLSARISDVNFNTDRFRKFCWCRHLIGPAWNYYYLMQVIDSKVLRSNRETEIVCQELLKEQKSNEHSSFEKNFFRARNSLRDTDHSGWLSLIRPYKIVGKIRKYLESNGENFFLVTTRDSDSVKDLLMFHHLEFLECNIFSKNEFAIHNSKSKIIQGLICNKHIEKSIFIDDLESHLVACKGMKNMLLLLARWGYVVPEKKGDNRLDILQEIEKLIQEENVRA